MKALRFRQFGAPSVLTIEEVPSPVPGDGETLVAVRAAAINPSDVKNVAGWFSGTTLPRTPGRDFAGVVAGGSGVVGQEVWSSAPGFGMSRDGVQAELVVVPSEILARKPANLSMEQAAAIGVPFITAWAAVVCAAQLQAGETILIVGAAGAVGRAATQVAQWKGARVLAGDTRLDRVKGVDAVIDTTKEDLRERVLALTNGVGADAVFDTVGGATFEPSLRALRAGGRQVVIASTGDHRVSFNLLDFYHNNSRLIGVDSNRLSSGDLADITRELSGGFEAGALRPPAVEVVSFQDAVAAYQRVESGRASVRQILAP